MSAVMPRSGGRYGCTSRRSTITSSSSQGRAGGFTVEDAVQHYSFQVTRSHSSQTGRPQAAEPLQVPQPTGRYDVGTRLIALTDRARSDPFAAHREHRRVLIQIYYPAAT